MSTIYEGWAVIEMMGHRKFAGKVTPVEGYSGLLTIEMPGAERPIIVGAGAIFQITPVEQEFAQMVGKQYLENSAWGAPHLRTLLPGEELQQLAATYDPEDNHAPDGYFETDVDL
ncbi:MAG: hypothetical protein IH587_14540 [Anaerolineae bacterium]|nr:hypothetical protein [Anaerolineae bacterium]